MKCRKILRFFSKLQKCRFTSPLFASAAFRHMASCQYDRKSSIKSNDNRLWLNMRLKLKHKELKLPLKFFTFVSHGNLSLCYEHNLQNLQRDDKNPSIDFKRAMSDSLHFVSYRFTHLQNLRKQQYFATKLHFVLVFLRNIVGPPLFTDFCICIWLFLWRNITSVPTMGSCHVKSNYIHRNAN